MKIAHETYTHEELADFRPVIQKILLQNSRSVVAALIQSRSRDDPGRAARRSNKAVDGVQCASIHIQTNCEHIIMKHRIDSDSPDFMFLPEFGRAVLDLWAEEIIPVLLDHPSRLSVDDNAAYFFAETQRIVAEEYVPSIEDILHATERGILETCFKMGQLSIRVLQVYGQECEPRKWIHVFEGVTEESFALFEAVVNSRWFLRTSVLLFLTDMAEFRTKLHEVPLTQFFIEYSGGMDVNKGAKYILWRFMQLNRARISMYPHITEASSVQNVRLLFTAVKERILQNALIDSDIL